MGKDTVIKGKPITDYTALPNFERKVSPAWMIKADDTQGIVEHIVAVTGNIDEGMDRIIPGAFAKTIVERGTRIKCLDQHNTSSVTNIVGRPMEMREVSQNELPLEVLQRSPEALGGLLVKTQYALGTQRGREVFELVKGGFAPEASIGYDPTEVEFVTEVDKATGKNYTVRNLKQIRLWEYSNVVFGMNQSTAVLSAKEKADNGAPSEGKPYGIVEEDGKFNVYKLDADGKPTGSNLGSHDDRDSATAQLRALYANTEDEGKALKAGRVLARRNAARIAAAIASLNDALKDAGLLIEAEKTPPTDEEPEEEEEDDEEEEPKKSAETEAEPAISPLTKDRMLKLVNLEIEQNKLEV